MKHGGCNQCRDPQKGKKCDTQANKAAPRSRANRQTGWTQTTGHAGFQDKNPYTSLEARTEHVYRTDSRGE